jgi:hypothetical protein
MGERVRLVLISMALGAAAAVAVVMLLAHLLTIRG